jgi:hypothetical protein
VQTNYLDYSNCTSDERKHQNVPLIEENTQLYPSWKKTPNSTPCGRKCPIVPLVAENTQLYPLWKKIPNCTPCGRNYPIIPLVEENTILSLLWTTRGTIGYFFPLEVKLGIFFHKGYKWVFFP